MLSAFRFLKTDFALSVRAETVQPQIEAAMRNSIRIGAESVQVCAQIDYTIKRAGVFALRLALPAGYRIESVTGDKVSQWVERTENGAPLVEVTLKERTVGAYTLNLVLVQNYKLPPRRWPSRACIPWTRKSSGLHHRRHRTRRRREDRVVRWLDGGSLRQRARRAGCERRQCAGLQVHRARARRRTGLEAERHHRGRRAVGARRDHEHDHPDRNAGQRPHAGQIRHRQRAGEGVPGARARGLQERGDQRRANPSPRPDQRRMARRAARQGARRIRADA